MERFYYEEPTIKRKEEAINYINEHIMNNSKINGSGSLDDYIDDYEGWLEHLKRDKLLKTSEERVPGVTYFLIRENDNKIIGMVNIRLALNKMLREHGGNIGYGIRPKERKKGYNKINLYLALKVCDKHNIEDVLLDADINNPASWKTMEALGGKKIKEIYDEEDNTTYVKYKIKVKDSLNKYKTLYEDACK